MRNRRCSVASLGRPYGISQIEQIKGVLAHAGLPECFWKSQRFTEGYTEQHREGLPVCFGNHQGHKGHEGKATRGGPCVRAKRTSGPKGL